MDNGSSEGQDSPSKCVPCSRERLLWKRLPSTWELACNDTLSARTEPMRHPRTITSSANALPSTCAFSPSTSATQWTSPKTRPLRGSSPFDVTLPVIVSSSSIMEIRGGLDSCARADVSISCTPHRTPLTAQYKPQNYPPPYAEALLGLAEVGCVYRG